MGRRTPRQRLSRQDWLEMALSVMAKEIRTGGLRIQSLCTALKVSRGSFYWHFKDRNDFIQALLEYWFEEYTAKVPATVERDGGTAEERLMRLMQLINDHDLTRHDLTIRSMATFDSRISSTLKKADQFRLDFIDSLFSEMGFTEKQLQIRAKACLAYMSLEHDVFVNLDLNSHPSLIDDFHAFLVRK